MVTPDVLKRIVHGCDESKVLTIASICSNCSMCVVAAEAI
jgi:hypothetical protein